VNFVDACLLRIENPDVTVDDLMDLMAERVGGRTPRRLDRIRRVAKE
jgi:hypothetical protein